MVMKIAIVAGEASGDLLGSHLMAALKKHHPHIEFIGIAGPKMIGEGAKSLFSIEQLSVRGYVEVIKHLPGLLKLRRALFQQLLATKPDLFIGVDAPDFNFWLEKKLKNKGIPAIHYVSPSIWAWRKGRIGGIKKAVSHILALFPFEPAIYQKAGIPVTYVGHPLADILLVSYTHLDVYKRQDTYTALMPFQTHKEWLNTAAKLRHLDLLTDKIKQLEKDLALLKSSL